MIAAVDAHLARWGGVGAIGRAEQPGWRFVDEELRQLDTQTFAVPLLFLATAAFILHMVLSRLVDTQREIIALLKAVGYANAAIALHYAKLALVVVAGGAALGIAVGIWASAALVDLYARYFRFDVLEVEVEPAHLVAAVGMAIGAGLVGALLAVRRAVALEPAAAMQPPTPPPFTAGMVDKLPGFDRLSVVPRMILRQAARRPGRTSLSIAGIALAGGLVVVGNAGMRCAVRSTCSFAKRNAKTPR
ncbi:MAG: ABC transporter permease [Deltaproteobacteria bacterium]|nr:ABC transporter permease [Deltaproteobacteria bacterium]